MRASASPACCSASSASSCAWRCASSAAACAAAVRLLGQSPGLGELLRRLGDELLRAGLRRLGLVLGVLELVVDLGADRLLVLVGVRLRLLALAADGLVGRLLRLGDALLDPARVSRSTSAIRARPRSPTWRA